MRYIKAQKILSSYKNTDIYFGTSYSMNIYRGCQHGCIYCDSRSDVYQLGDLSDIRVKEEALQTLTHELRTKRRRGTIGTGAMNDPYMPIEAELQLVRKALELIAYYHWPVHIMTKSDLVVRDIDVIQKIAQPYAAVSLSITTANDELSKIIEPVASISSQRFEAIKKLTDAGIYAGVVLTPSLPFITDTVDNITAIVEQAKLAGAKYILFWPAMTLREGQREYYYKRVEKYFPELTKKYIQCYGDRYQCLSLMANELSTHFAEACKKANMPMTMKFYKPEEYTQLTLF